jgi:hypothetical protein
MMLASVTGRSVTEVEFGVPNKWKQLFPGKSANPPSIRTTLTVGGSTTPSYFEKSQMRTNGCVTQDKD